MKTFEYMELTFNGRDITIRDGKGLRHDHLDRNETDDKFDVLNSFGHDGWEIISTRNVDYIDTYFFKREL